MATDATKVEVSVGAPGADEEEEIRCCIGVGTGISKDVRRRLPLYADDWKRGMSVGLHIFAPATYIFFASFLPALAFGEQFREETTGLFSIPHILCATAIAGVLQSCVGGQPLLIVGVAEPIVLTYYYIFKYCESQSDVGVALFRPFCAWVLIFTALMHFVLALVNASEYIHAFTRFSGETFGTLIAVLFLQAAVKGLKEEFNEPHDAPIGYRTVQRHLVRVLALRSCCSPSFSWARGNGTWVVGRCATSSPITAPPSRWSSSPASLTPSRHPRARIGPFPPAWSACRFTTRPSRIPGRRRGISSSSPGRRSARPSSRPSSSPCSSSSTITCPRSLRRRTISG